MSATPTERKVNNATGVDIVVPLDAQSVDKKDLNSFKIVVIASLAQYKPAKLADVPTVQV